MNIDLFTLKMGYAAKAKNFPLPGLGGKKVWNFYLCMITGNVSLVIRFGNKIGIK